MTVLTRAPATLSSQLFSIAVRRNASTARFFHPSPLRTAVAHPITAHGPPPKAPAPAPEFGEQQKQEQQQQQQQAAEEKAKIAETEKETPARPSKPSALKKRFWKNVDVRKKPGRLYERKEAGSLRARDPKADHAMRYQRNIKFCSIPDLSEHRLRMSSRSLQPSLIWHTRLLWSGM